MLTLLFSLLMTQAHASTEVIYFGGFEATNAEMQCWQAGAEAQPAYAHVAFETHAYPAGASSSAASAQSHGAATINAVVAEIEAHPEIHFVVVGHSSGAALSDKVAQLVKNPSNMELVNLDGFAPSAAVQKRMKSTCVYAVSSKINGLTSLNAASMKGNCLNSEAYTDAHCTTPWCMHFSLVNEKAPSALSSSTFAAHGYDGCSTNLSWLAP